MADPPDELAQLRAENENLRQWLRVLYEFTSVDPFDRDPRLNSAYLIDDVTRWAILSSIAARGMRGEQAPANAEAYECVRGWFDGRKKRH